MRNIIAILRSQQGQSTVEILMGMVGVAIIAVAVSQALKAPVGNMHDRVIDGITSVTGSGM
jgi:hypothetical protein